MRSSLDTNATTYIPVYEGDFTTGFHKESALGLSNQISMFFRIYIYDSIEICELLMRPCAVQHNLSPSA